MYLDRIQTLEKSKGRSRMDIQEKLTILGTQDIRRRQTKQKQKHDMYWTPPYTRHKTKRKKNTQHNMCWTPLYAQKHK